MTTVRTVVPMLLIIVATRAVFFMIFSYLMTGDAFLALKNFYNMSYNLKI